LRLGKLQVRLGRRDVLFAVRQPVAGRDQLVKPRLALLDLFALIAFHQALVVGLGLCQEPRRLTLLLQQVEGLKLRQGLSLVDFVPFFDKDLLHPAADARTDADLIAFNESRDLQRSGAPLAVEQSGDQHQAQEHERQNAFDHAR
jgi:hypothetical protein